MNKRFEELMYHAGLTAQGCWDSMDEYDHQAIEKFAESIVLECIKCIQLTTARDPQHTVQYKQSVGHIHKIREHFGLQE